MSKYYDGTKLLTMRDITGEKPEIYMCCGNRTAGKTFYFKRMLLRRFIKTGAKFAVLVRFKYEMDGISRNFFQDIGPMFFAGHEMSDKAVGKDLFTELYFDGKPCGYCIPINSADTIKKNSARFTDVEAIFFDEFQSESDKYCTDEFEKFVSIHISIARGNGKQTRYVPVYMCSNAYSVLNMYFVRMGVHKRLGNNTKFLRGDGWVLEMTINTAAAKAYTDSSFARAVSGGANGQNYLKYVTQNKFLADSNSFICKMSGNARLFTQVVKDGKVYGIWSYEREGFMYVSHKSDPSWPLNLAFNTKDHDVNLVLVQRSAYYLKHLKTYFDLGYMRFEDIDCKNAFMDFVGYATK